MSSLENKGNIEKLILIQQSLAIMVKQREEIIKEKDKEIESLKSEIKKIKTEQKNTEINNKNNYINISSNIEVNDINEIKQIFEKEKSNLEKIIKTLKNEIDKKNEYIKRLNEELNKNRDELQTERKLNIKLIQTNPPNKLNNDHLLSEYYKISNENSSLKLNQINILEDNDLLNYKINKINENKNDSLNNNAYEKYNKNIKNDYNNLLKQFIEYSKKYSEKSKQNYALLKQKKTLEENIDIINKEIKEKEKENIILNSENDGMRKRIQTFEYQIESLKNEIKELEKVITENKFSKRVFYVAYYYLGMPMNVNITIEKGSENKFSFIIENKTSTRKLSLLDVDVLLDKRYKDKIIIKLLKTNDIEEYTTTESQKLLDTFVEFKKRFIELNDVGSDSKINTENQEKVTKAQQQLNNFFNII